MMKRYDWDDYIIIYNEKMVNNVNLRFVTLKCHVLWYYEIITKNSTIKCKPIESWTQNKWKCYLFKRMVL